MKKVAVVGVGQTRFSGPQDKTEVELFAEAAMEAINESNLGLVLGTAESCLSHANCGTFN